MTGRTAFYMLLGTLLLAALWLRGRPRPLFCSAVARPTDTTLGTAGQGLHELHLLGVAVADFVGTVVLATVYALVSRGSFVAWLVLLLTLGEVMHWYFGVPTATSEWLFPTARGDGN